MAEMYQGSSSGWERWQLGRKMCSLVLRGVLKWRRGVRIACLVSIALATATHLLCRALAESGTGVCMGLVVPSLTEIICAGA